MISIVFSLFLKVEGIGKKFLPAGMDRTITDKWYKMHDKDGFLYARKLINDEGLLCGEQE